jgi:hypothetical protein
MMSENLNLKTHADAGTSSLTMQKWGGLASFLLVAAFVAASLIYLIGNLRDAFGPFSYSLADFLAGPVMAASLLTVVFALRERMNDHAPRRMSLAMTTAFLAAGAMVLVACIRSANRHYHLTHPDLHLEDSTTVLVVWATLVAGVTGAGWHFLGWTLALIGSAGWTSGALPRALSVLYMAAGIASLFVYVFPNLEPFVGTLAMLWGVWQGIVFLKN